jgi:LPXTG-site transpeptidase (sortase) family protein
MSQYHNKKPQRESFLDLVWNNKFSLAAYILFISFFTFTLLYIAGGVPRELRVLDPKETGAQPKATSTIKTVTTVEVKQEPIVYPTKIIIDKIAVNATIRNPESANNTVLNNELLKGAVRYPGSGTPGKGNMFIFGHSTGIRVVNNQAYKTFNNLNKLVEGDIIQVQAAGKTYSYKVKKVSLVDSADQRVEFNATSNILTLSTCNVFGAKEERFVVVADFVEAKKL